MPIIKFVNEDDEVEYKTEDVVKTLLYYAFNPEKQKRMAANLWGVNRFYSKRSTRKILLWFINLWNSTTEDSISISVILQSTGWFHLACRNVYSHAHCVALQKTLYLFMRTKAILQHTLFILVKIIRTFTLLWMLSHIRT